MAADLLQTTGNLLNYGSGQGLGVSVGFILVMLVILIIGGLASAGIVVWITYIRQFKIKIKKFEKINGRYIEVATIRARVIPIGNGGDSAFMLRKPKKVLPIANLQSGINTYNYFVSSDGEWINFEHSDFDEDRRTMGAHMLDKEMRYARTSLQHLAKERYDPESFWKKYGGVIAYSVLIVVTFVGMFLIVKEMATTASAAASMAQVSADASVRASEATKEVLHEVARLLGAVDTIQGGSGLTPAV